jgi:hypothetical protein
MKQMVSQPFHTLRILRMRTGGSSKKLVATIPNPMRHFVPIIFAVALAGCQTIDQQRRNYIDIKNAEIGRPLYNFAKIGTREVRLSKAEVEFIPDPIPISGCGVAWMVDTQTKGPYHHPNGIIFTIEGIKKSWRFVGDSQKCREEVHFWSGAW